MITLANIRDWIKTFGVGEHFYIGKLDNKQDKSIGVYQRESYGPAEIALGGLECTKTEKKQISILVHWNKNAKETEEKAMYLYRTFLCQNNVTINNIHVDYIYLGVPEPVSVGTDDKGVYEYVIWLDLYYQKGE
ncbi:MAG: minor capsid protein [Agathobacter sp.]